MPFLHRLQARMQTAVLRTGLVEDVSRVSAQTDESLSALHRHSALLDQHSAILKRHSTILDQQSGTLERQAASNEAAANATERAFEAVQAAIGRLDALATSQTAKLDALGRGLPNLRMTAARIEHAIETQAQRLTLVHDALQTAVLPLVPRIERMEADLASLAAQVVALDSLVSSLHGHLAGMTQQAATTAQHAQALLNRNTIPLPGGDLAVRTPKGYVLVPGDDAGLLVYLAEGGGHELGTIEVLEALLRPGETAIDIGAHVGLMVVPMARRVGPTGSIQAFEPSPRTAACLRRTILLNGLGDWTTVHERAVGEHSGRHMLHFGVNSALNSLVPIQGSTSGTEVEVVRLDDVIAPGSKVALLKLDVEGAELAVLAGMQRVLQDNPDLLVVAEYGNEHLQRSGQSAATWIQAFVAAGLDGAWCIDEAQGICSPITPEGLAAKDGSVNLVLAHHGSPRLARLRTA